MDAESLDFLPSFIKSIYHKYMHISIKVEIVMLILSWNTVSIESRIGILLSDIHVFVYMYYIYFLHTQLLHDYWMSVLQCPIFIYPEHREACPHALASQTEAG